jgi:hypothetical protein
MHPRRPIRGFTSEAIEHARRRYEETDETQDSIAADFGVSRKTLDRLAKNEGWALRKDRPPRDLPSELRLYDAAEQALLGEAGADAPSRTALADRLERAVEKELATVELMRANLGPIAGRSIEAERTARTLERLTETLSKVRRLREPGTPMTGSNDFDTPTDIDEFRRALAQRIENFVRSRTDAAVSPAGDTGEPDPPQ